jgi:hypothetical protein
MQMGKKATRKQLDERLNQIQEALTALTPEERKAHIETLIRDFFVTARGTLVKWSELTGQSAQIDTGYVAQHLASLLLGVPGQGFRGKGLDLRDGSEVKSASTVSGVDVPRWNHNLSTAAADENKRTGRERTTADGYLDSPTVVYVLFDHPKKAVERLRIRVWCVNGREDAAWRQIINRFQETKSGATYNLQLHPPANRDDQIVTNLLGNLDLTNVLVMQVEFDSPEMIEDLAFEWKVEPNYPIAPVNARAELVEREVAEELSDEDRLAIAGLTDLSATQGDEELLEDGAIVVRPEEPPANDDS